MAIVIKFVQQIMSKGEVAEVNIRERNVEYDSAIPQIWVNRVYAMCTDEQLEEFGNIASHFVYVYDNKGQNRTEYIMPLTKIGCKILGTLALHI